MQQAVDEVKKLQDLLHRAAIQEAVIRFFYALDSKDWMLCRSCFTETVEVDYVDLRGEQPSLMTAEAFVEQRQIALTPLRTLHQNTNHVITLEVPVAWCVSNAVIYRWGTQDGIEESFHTYAMYTYHLTSTEHGWKISRVKQKVVASIGNPALHRGVKR